MKKNIFLALLISVALFIIFPSAASAYDYGGKTYDDTEYNNIKAFLEMPSVVGGKTNAEQLGYTVADPSTWSHVSWVYPIDVNHPRVFGLNWNNKLLSGSLNVSGAGYLSALYCNQNAITAINVESCTNLGNLTCSGTNIAELNLSTNTQLSWLECNDTYSLTELDTSAAGENLMYLHCTNSAISSLNISSNTKLYELFCGFNHLSALNVSGLTSLSYLACYQNSMNSLNITGCTGLEKLECYSNNLTELDLTGCSALEELICKENSLTELDITVQTSLNTLDCSSNDMTKITGMSGKPLTDLNCSDNPLSSLDVSGLADLVYLDCNGCGLSSLDVSGNGNLTTLICSGNSLATLDVSGISGFNELDCTDNPMASLRAVLNGHNVELSASGSGYATLYFNDFMRQFLPDGYYALAVPANGAALRDWTNTSDAVVSTDAKYYLNGDNAYDLTANFLALTGGGSSHTSSPTVIGGSASDITFSSATLTGNVLSGGGMPITERGFVYSTRPNPQLGGTGVLFVTADGRTGSFTVTLTDLAPGTTYYARSYAVNTKGVTYGATIQFETTAIVDAASVPKTGDAGILPAAGILCLTAVAAMTLLMIDKRRFVK